jgi:hypothetical protein
LTVLFNTKDLFTKLVLTFLERIFGFEVVAITGPFHESFCVADKLTGFTAFGYTAVCEEG